MPPGSCSRRLAPFESVESPSEGRWASMADAWQGATTGNSASRFALALSELRGLGRARLRAQLRVAASHSADGFTSFAEFVGQHGSDAGLADIGELGLTAAWDRAGSL